MDCCERSLAAISSCRFGRSPSLLGLIQIIAPKMIKVQPGSVLRRLKLGQVEVRLLLRYSLSIVRVAVVVVVVAYQCFVPSIAIERMNRRMDRDAFARLPLPWWRRRG